MILSHRKHAAFLTFALILTLLLTACMPKKLPAPSGSPASFTQGTNAQTASTPTQAVPGFTLTPEQSEQLSEVVLKGTTAAVYDLTTGQYLYQTHPSNTSVYPASLTKLFTAYTALQYLSTDEIVTAGDELNFVAPDASVAFIRPGHQLTVEMLIEGMLLPSGNDAAYVIAAAAGRKIAGEEIACDTALDTFMEEMNRQAAINGMTGSHFAVPDGYHHPEHYTSIEDLITIAKLALDNEVILRYAALPSDQVTYVSGQTNTWINTNMLIHPESEFYRENALGLKTGRTKEAGYALLSAFRTRTSYTIIYISSCETHQDRFADTLQLYDILNRSSADRTADQP